MLEFYEVICLEDATMLKVREEAKSGIVSPLSRMLIPL
jgi:hypothetical protein